MNMNNKLLQRYISNPIPAFKSEEVVRCDAVNLSPSYPNFVEVPNLRDEQSMVIAHDNVPSIEVFNLLKEIEIFDKNITKNTSLELFNLLCVLAKTDIVIKNSKDLYRRVKERQYVAQVFN